MTPKGHFEINWPLTNVKNESFPNKKTYSSFQSVEATNFKTSSIAWIGYLETFTNPILFLFFPKIFESKEKILKKLEKTPWGGMPSRD